MQYNVSHTEITGTVPAVFRPQMFVTDEHLTERTGEVRCGRIQYVRR